MTHAHPENGSDGTKNEPIFSPLTKLHRRVAVSPYAHTATVRNPKFSGDDCLDPGIRSCCLKFLPQCKVEAQLYIQKGVFEAGKSGVL